jgi:hypothetical protein
MSAACFWLPLATSRPVLPDQRESVARHVTRAKVHAADPLSATLLVFKSKLPHPRQLALVDIYKVHATPASDIEKC